VWSLCVWGFVCGRRSFGFSHAKQASSFAAQLFFSVLVEGLLEHRETMASSLLFVCALACALLATVFGAPLDDYVWRY
jgi:hypothetical protein